MFRQGPRRAVPVETQGESAVGRTAGHPPPRRVSMAYTTSRASCTRALTAVRRWVPSSGAWTPKRVDVEVPVLDCSERRVEVRDPGPIAVFGATHCELSAHGSGLCPSCGRTGRESRCSALGSYTGSASPGTFIQEPEAPALRSSEAVSVMMTRRSNSATSRGETPISVRLRLGSGILILSPDDSRSESAPTASRWSRSTSDRR